MCQSNVYAVERVEETLVLEDVASMRIDGDQITMRTLFGEPVSLEGRIKEINLMKHRIVLERHDAGES
jgi:predicted RNA-binding protein